jgi:hypothetical protein
MFEPKATASHSDSTKMRSVGCNQPCPLRPRLRMCPSVAAMAARGSLMRRMRVGGEEMAGGRIVAQRAAPPDLASG